MKKLKCQVRKKKNFAFYLPIKWSFDLLTTISKVRNRLQTTAQEKTRQIVRFTNRRTEIVDLSSMPGSMHLKKKLVKTLEVKLDCLTYNIWWSFGLTRGNFYINFWSRFIFFVFTHFERFVRFSFKESQMSWQNWSNIWITRNSLELSPKTKLWKKSLIWCEI